MKNDSVNVWLDVISGFALGFLSSVLIDSEEDFKSNEKKENNQVEDLGYAVIVEDE